MTDDRKTAEKFLAVIERFSEGEAVYQGAIKSLKDGIYEFRCNRRGHWLRVLWFYDENNGRVVICTHAFIKKSNETPKGEIRKARDLLRAYKEARRSGDVEFIEE